MNGRFKNALKDGKVLKTRKEKNLTYSLLKYDDDGDLLYLVFRNEYLLDYWEEDEYESAEKQFNNFSGYGGKK